MWKNDRNCTTRFKKKKNDKKKSVKKKKSKKEKKWEAVGWLEGIRKFQFTYL